MYEISELSNKINHQRPTFHIFIFPRLLMSNLKIESPFFFVIIRENSFRILLTLFSVICSDFHYFV